MLSWPTSHHCRMIWKDIRLHFKNLREDRQLNIVLPEDAKEIWVPVVDFLNAEGNQNSEVDLHSKVTIKRLGGKVEDNVELSKEGEKSQCMFVVPRFMGYRAAGVVRAWPWFNDFGVVRELYAWWFVAIF